MKILSIGNSFSTDATAYLEAITSSMNKNVLVRNLYIGGCSLEMHSQNIINNASVYEFQKNGDNLRFISIEDALKDDIWDYVTIQQVSHLSGVPASYEPYIGILIDKIHQLRPSATIRFHRTWAYDIDSDHPNFPDYGSSQEHMYQKIVETTNEICGRYQISIIPTGDLIQHFRKMPAFDMTKGGLSLCRDGFHLSFDYGRYIAALSWIVHFLDPDISKVSFIPATAAKDIITEINAEISRIRLSTTLFDKGCISR